MNEKDQEQLFTEVLDNLKYTISTHSASHRHVAFRVRILIRSLMLGLVSALAFILYLLYILTTQVDVMTSTLNKISEEADSVQVSMSSIALVMQGVESYMQEMPAVYESVSGMDRNVALMRDNMVGIQGNIYKISQEVDLLQDSMQKISRRVQTLDHTLVGINQDMGSASLPFRRFNQMSPF